MEFDIGADDADGLHVRLSKSEIGDLPELGVHRTW